MVDVLLRDSMTQSHCVIPPWATFVCLFPHMEVAMVDIVLTESFVNLHYLLFSFIPGMKLQYLGLRKIGKSNTYLVSVIKENTTFTDKIKDRGYESWQNYMKFQ